MPYGKSDDISKLKKKIEEKMPGIDVDNLTENDMKKMLMNEINKNSSIDPAIKDKINKGDIEGLKEDLINYLSRSKGGDGQKLAKMLKNNDMEGLKNHLVSMLLGSINSQKKNDVADNGTEDGINTPNASALSLFEDKAIINTIMSKLFEFNKNDNRVVFLNSMKPFVSEKRQKSIDDCIKIISLIAFFERFSNKVGN